MMILRSRHRQKGPVIVLLAFSACTDAFFTTPLIRESSQRQTTSTTVFLQTGLQMPILDLIGDDNEARSSSSTSTATTTTGEDDDVTVIPLPSSHLPSEIATPFLYGMQVTTPLHKLLLEEATSSIGDMGIAISTTSGANGIAGAAPQAIYGHLVWKDKTSDSLVGAIGCTSQILVNAPTTEVFNPSIAEELDESSAASSSSSSSSLSSLPSDTPPSTVLCRGGFRFVVKEVIKTIPYPVAIVDEIEDDAEIDDSDFFAMVSNSNESNNDDDEEEDAKYRAMSSAELIQKTMRGIQTIISDRVAATSDKEISPLEKQILESSGMSVDPNKIEQAQAIEMAAVFDVFQEALVDDIPPQDRKFAIAIMAAELADMNNNVRERIIISRDAEERLRIVLKEIEEIVGMANARKVASQITGQVDEDERDLKVGKPQLPPWAKTIVKGTKVEYFWNEEYSWCYCEVIDDPVTVVDEILLTVRFDDGEVHTLPLSAEDKVRWRPPQNKT